MAETATGHSVFVARQPILDGQQNTYAYELLFRSGLESRCNFTDGDSATLDVIANTFLEIGVDDLTAGKPCFINFTRKLLLQNVPQLLPPELMVVEILEDIEPDKDVLWACRGLCDAGYTLALDDFVLADQGSPFLDVTKIVKVDFMGTTPDQRRTIAADLNERGILALAEKVETAEEFEQAEHDGYAYFQGYFFSKPVVHEGKALEGNNLTYLRLLQEVSRPELSYQELETTIKQDVSLTYRLLRFINSAWFGLRHEIDSIHHALVWLGPPEIRKWFSLVCLRNMATDKPGELMIEGITRAKMAESLAEHLDLDQQKSELFLMGMFSILDALLDKPMPEILPDLPINPEIKSALLGQSCRFRQVLDAVIAFERGDWGTFSAHAATLGLPEDAVQAALTESVKWATNAFNVSG